MQHRLLQVHRDRSDGGVSGDQPAVKRRGTVARRHDRSANGGLGLGCGPAPSGSPIVCVYRLSIVLAAPRDHLAPPAPRLPELRRRVTAPSPLPVLRFTRVPAMISCCLLLKGAAAVYWLRA